MNRATSFVDAVGTEMILLMLFTSSILFTSICLLGRGTSRHTWKYALAITLLLFIFLLLMRFYLGHLNVINMYHSPIPTNIDKLTDKDIKNIRAFAAKIRFGKNSSLVSEEKLIYKSGYEKCILNMILFDAMIAKQQCKETEAKLKDMISACKSINRQYQEAQQIRENVYTTVCGCNRRYLWDTIVKTENDAYKNDIINTMYLVQKYGDYKLRHEIRRIDKGCGCTTETRILARLEEAKIYLRHNDIDEAKREYREAMRCAEESKIPKLMSIIQSEIKDRMESEGQNGVNHCQAVEY